MSLLANDAKRLLGAMVALLLMTSCGKAVDHSPVAESFRNACVRQNSNSPEYCECILSAAEKSFSNEHMKEMWLLMSSRNPYNGREQQSNQMAEALSEQDFRTYIASAKSALSEANGKCEPIKYKR